MIVFSLCRQGVPVGSWWMPPLLGVAAIGGLPALGSVSVEDFAVELYGPHGILVGLVDLWDLRYGPGWLSVVGIVESRGACCSCCVFSDLDGLLVGPWTMVIDAGLVDLVPGPLCDGLLVGSWNAVIDADLMDMVPGPLCDGWYVLSMSSAM